MRLIKRIMTIPPWDIDYVEQLASEGKIILTPLDTRGLLKLYEIEGSLEIVEEIQSMLRDDPDES